MCESNPEERVKVIGVIFEVLRGIGEEALQNVKASEHRVEVGILQQFPDIGLELRPGPIILVNDGARDFTNRVSDMLLHAEIVLTVNDLEDLNLDLVLQFDGQLVPHIGVGGGAEVGEAEAQLGG